MIVFPARLISVVESMDNGKPIRESRDLDIPLVARHFYHHAGTSLPPPPPPPCEVWVLSQAGLN